MDVLFSLAEIKIIQSNQGVFKSFAINQSELSINYKEFFLFFLISTNQSFNSHRIFNKFNVNQSELSFNSHGIFNKVSVNQSELSSTSDEFVWTILISFVVIEDTLTGSICGNNQSEWSIRRFEKNFVDQNQTMFIKLPNQTILLNFSNKTKI